MLKMTIFRILSAKTLRSRLLTLTDLQSGCVDIWSEGRSFDMTL